ncbi:acyl-coenzyme A thioesterase 13 [Aplysia californica]|uniref:Acyl-coenzyme A thioesterase 13 n=1 Tax=Aplysia californica TaxID=6500 RepID=A0ABM1A942_APLCA|nr:acyl-coenzyme A thioesterase 13 [Aplysia californica]
MNPVRRLTLEGLRKVVKQRVDSNGFENLFKEMKVLSGGDGQCCCELRVTSPLMNARGSLHGGVTASLVDAVSTYALMTTGTGAPGISMDLNVSYLKPVKLDDSVVVEAKTLSCGRTLAVATVDIRSKQTGQLVAHGRHSKFVGQKVSSDPA